MRTACAELPLSESHCPEETPSLPCFSRKACLSPSTLCLSTLDKGGDIRSILCFLHHHSARGKEQKSTMQVPAYLVAVTWPQGQEPGREQLGAEQREAAVPAERGPRHLTPADCCPIRMPG